jgi:hypothetical protein
VECHESKESENIRLHHSRVRGWCIPVARPRFRFAAHPDITEMTIRTPILFGQKTRSGLSFLIGAKETNRTLKGILTHLREKFASTALQVSGRVVFLGTTPIIYFFNLSQIWSIERCTSMKTLLLTLGATAGLILSAISCQAQALIAIPAPPNVAPAYPAAVMYFDDYGTLRHAALVPWWDPAALIAPVAPGRSYVFTSSGEVSAWAPGQYGPISRK